MSRELGLAVLISGSGSNLQAIIDAIEAGELNASINIVISNNPDAYGLQRAQKHSLPVTVLDHHEYASRELYDAALQQQLAAVAPDAVREQLNEVAELGNRFIGSQGFYDCEALIRKRY